MLGREIKINEPPKINQDKPKLFYIKELSYGIKNIDDVRPPTVPIVGMDKIRAKGWKAFFIDYASSSSFHGVNHLAAPNRHIVERFLAVMFIVVGFIGLVFLSLYFWNKYQYNATVYVLSHDFHHYKILQPAIVICPVLGVDANKFPDVFKKYGIEDTVEMRDFFTTISRKSNGYNGSLPEIVNIPSDQWLSILNDLKMEFDYASSRTASFAEWIVTDLGFCQTIFSDIAPYSSYDYWKNNNWTIVREPKNYRFCEFLSSGCATVIDVKVIDVLFGIAPSDDIIDFDGNNHEVASKYKADLTLNIEEIISSDDVKDLSPTQRNCLFDDENKLTMWPIYTLKMCQKECKCKQTLKLCGCYHHFSRPTAGIPICNLTQLKCIDENKSKIMKFDEKRMEECGCMSDCNDLRYTTDEYSNFLTATYAPEQLSLSIQTKFPLDKYMREVVFGFIDCLAAVGGSAGLLLGASILSFVEFFYYATLRCWWHYYRMIHRND